LECLSPNKVHGHVVPLDACRRILQSLAALPEAQRRRVRGLHPDRAPTIVAGVVMVIEALELFGLDAIEVSDHDILRGAALEVVHRHREDDVRTPGT
jgi:exopolyphosphatase / guanosine-5'-triphosphate,3'-diphosphate pyrophosphatase